MSSKLETKGSELPIQRPPTGFYTTKVNTIYGFKDGNATELGGAFQQLTDPHSIVLIDKAVTDDFKITWMNNIISAMLSNKPIVISIDNGVIVGAEFQSK